MQALKDGGTATLALVQNAIYRATLVQMRLGMFDEPSSLPWYNLGPQNVTTPRNLEISYNAAQQGQVLLKNLNNALPILNTTISSIALIGPNANNTKVMEGNYYGNPPFIYSVYEGLKQYVSKVDYEEGCAISSQNTTGFAAAINAAKNADLTVMVMGLDQSQEAEGHDRGNILLPGVQYDLIEQVSTASKGKTILVILSGGCVDISNQTNSNKIAGIIWGGYPGMY
eukprot:UN09399